MGRLRGLTKPRVCGRQAKAASQHNAGSPLLRLTPELRNRIYDFVLGGNVIHVDIVGGNVSPKKTAYRLCQSATVDETFAPFARDALSLPGGEPYKTYDTRHAFCYRSGYQHDNRKSVPIVDSTRHAARQPPAFIEPPTATIKRPDLSLLQVCAQIYLETALLPFELNTFAVHDMTTLALLSEQLLFVQTHAVRRVIVCARFNDILLHRRKLQFPESIWNALSGLRHLVAIYECSPDPADSSSSAERPHFKAVDLLRELRRIPFDSVRISTYYTPATSGHESCSTVRMSMKSMTEGQRAYHVRLREHARRIEDYLLDYDVERLAKRERQAQRESARKAARSAEQRLHFAKVRADGRLRPRDP